MKDVFLFLLGYFIGTIIVLIVEAFLTVAKKSDEDIFNLNKDDKQNNKQLKFNF